jgi:hypothetical protein
MVVLLFVLVTVRVTVQKIVPLLVLGHVRVTVQKIVPLVALGRVRVTVQKIVRLLALGRVLAIALLTVQLVAKVVVRIFLLLSKGTQIGIRLVLHLPLVAETAPVSAQVDAPLVVLALAP